MRGADLRTTDLAAAMTGDAAAGHVHGGANIIRRSLGDLIPKRLPGEGSLQRDLGHAG